MSAMRQATANPDGELRDAIGTLGLGAPTANSSLTEIGAIASSLEHFLDLMLKWNRVFNLTAITARDQMITHHLVDSLAIVPTLDRLLAGQTQPRLLDVGTGAGLPGIPLAVTRPDWHLTLLDSNSKKTAFVTQAVAELGLTNVTVNTGRVEQLHHATHEHYDAIVSRAFSSLLDFVNGTRHLLADDGTWVAMKGVVPQDEIQALPYDIECSAVVPVDVPGLDAERHLILMKAKR